MQRPGTTRASHLERERVYEFHVSKSRNTNLVTIYRFIFISIFFFILSLSIYSRIILFVLFLLRARVRRKM